MTIPKLLQQKRDELAVQISKVDAEPEYYKKYPEIWDLVYDMEYASRYSRAMGLSYKEGFKDCAAFLLPEIEKLREALKFYGNTLNWEHHNNQKPLDWGRPIIKYDDCKHVFNDEWCSYGGDKARQALQSIEEFLGEESEGVSIYEIK